MGLMDINRRFPWQLTWTCMLIYADGLSTRGKHFIIGIPESRILAEYPVIRFYITTLSAEAVSVVIKIPYFPGQHGNTADRRFPVTAGEVVVQEYSSTIQAEGTSLEDKGIILEASGDISVQVGVINDFSSDGFLAIPTEAISTEYYVITYLYKREPELGTKQGPSQLLVVAAEDDTMVTIVFPESTPVDHVDDILRGLLLTPAHDNPRRMDIVLHHCQTLQIQSDMDLSGSKVVSSLPVAVVAGAVWSSVMAEEMGDHLVEQMPPTDSWGGEFFAVPVANRTSGDLFRVMAKLNGTKVYILRPGYAAKEIIYLDAGHYDDFVVEAGEIRRVVANRPILLMQLSTSYAADDSKFGDPFMALVTPTEQLSSAYSFSTLSSLFDNFFNFLTIWTDARNVRDVLLDGETIPDDVIYEEWLKIPGSDFRVAVISLPGPPGFHTLTCSRSNAKIGGILYGFQIQESYGMVLGQNLDSIGSVCVQVAHEWAELFDNDCDGKIDEEIANGVDDDGDGLIDEDVYNDKESRPQDGLFQGLGPNYNGSEWIFTVEENGELSSRFALNHSGTDTVQAEAASENGDIRHTSRLDDVFYKTTADPVDHVSLLEFKNASPYEFSSSPDIADRSDVTQNTAFKRLFPSLSTDKYGDWLSATWTGRQGAESTEHPHEEKTTSVPYVDTNTETNSEIKLHSGGKANSGSTEPVMYSRYSSTDDGSTSEVTVKTDKSTSALRHYFSTPREVISSDAEARFSDDTKTGVSHTTVLSFLDSKLIKATSASYHSSQNDHTNGVQISDTGIEQTSSSFHELNTEDTNPSRFSYSTGYAAGYESSLSPDTADVTSASLTSTRSVHVSQKFINRTGFGTLGNDDESATSLLTADYNAKSAVTVTDQTMTTSMMRDTQTDARRTSPLWQQHFKMVVIPISIVLGVPLLFCLFLCLRILFSYVCCNNKQKPSNMKKTNVAVRVLPNTRRGFPEKTKPVTRDCRNQFSNSCSY